MKNRSWLPALVSLLTIVTQVSAQESRGDLIDRARGEFDQSVVLELLMRAADPTVGALDSLWTVAVYDLAEQWVELDPEISTVLVSWGVRHGGIWGIDRALYSTSVLSAYDAAVVSGAGEGTGIETSWEWPSAFVAGEPGTLEVVGSEGVGAIEAEVTDQGMLPSSGRMNVGAGTYEVTVRADGFESLSVSREVLPGTMTTVEVALEPALPETVETDVRSRLAQITYVRGGAQVCVNGLLDAQGLVFTVLSALDQATNFEVVTVGGSYSDVRLLRTDPDRDLAVLELQTRSSSGLSRVQGASDGQAVWSVYRPGCGVPTRVRSRIASWTPASVIGLLDPVPAEAVGSPVVDRSGSLLGLVGAPTELISGPTVQELLNEAILAIGAEGAPTDPVGGGFPLKWVGAGVAAVGLGVALLSGGGENGPPPPTTGTITVVFPGGSP